MTSTLTDRLARLEGCASAKPNGKHLTFKVEAPSALPSSAIIDFLKARGHVIHDDDSTLVMRISVPASDASEAALRDLTPVLVTEEVRARASAAEHWPLRTERFTFHLDTPGSAQ